MAKKNESGYLSAKESRRISRENRKITDQFEKLHKRKNVPEEEFLTQMHDQNNSLEIENLHTYFFSGRRLLRRAHRQDRGRGGRVRLRQVRHQPVHHAAAPAAPGPDRGGRDSPESRQRQGLRHHQDPHRADAEAPRQLYVHDFPGAHDQPEPGVPHRCPAGRGHCPARR